jgi:hypothetical protein
MTLFLLDKLCDIIDGPLLGAGYFLTPYFSLRDFHLGEEYSDVLLELSEEKNICH